MTHTEPPFVLIVEDDQNLAKLVRRILERSGLRIKEAWFGKSALKYLEEAHLPILIILDYRLPDMTGADILAALGDRIKFIPVVMVTGYSDPAIEKRAREAGIYDFILKDMNLDFLKTLPITAREAINSAASAVSC